MVTNWVDRRSSILQPAVGSGIQAGRGPNGISLSAELTSAFVAAAPRTLEKHAVERRFPLSRSRGQPFAIPPILRGTNGSPEIPLREYSATAEALDTNLGLTITYLFNAFWDNSLSESLFEKNF